MNLKIKLYDGTRRKSTFWDGFVVGCTAVLVSVIIALIIVKVIWG